MGFVKGKDSVSGWAEATPTAPSARGASTSPAGTRQIYVSNPSSGGFGSDSNAGTDLAPYATIAFAASKLRDGKPDWLMLDQNCDWDECIGDLFINGQSEQDRMIFARWDPAGNPDVPNPATGNRQPTCLAPNINTSLITFLYNDTAVLGIKVTWPDRDPQHARFNGGGDSSVAVCAVVAGNNHYFEDIEATYFKDGINFPSASTGTIADDFVIRRCSLRFGYGNQINDAYGLQGCTTNVVCEQNLLDHNGWYNGQGNLGHDARSRNVYCGGGTPADTFGQSHKNNFVVNDSSGFQVRCGGQAFNNSFYRINYAFLGSFDGTPNSWNYNVFGGVQSIVIAGNEGIGTQPNAGGFNQDPFNRVYDNSIEVGTNIFSHETDTASFYLSLGAGVPNVNAHDNIAFLWSGGLINSWPNSVWEISVQTAGSNYLTGGAIAADDATATAVYIFKLTSDSSLDTGFVVYNDGVQDFRIRSNGYTGGNHPPWIICYADTTTVPSASGTLTKVSGTGDATLTYNGVYKIYHSVTSPAGVGDMGILMTGGTGSGLKVILWANLDGTIFKIEPLYGVYGSGHNYEQFNNGFTVNDIVSPSTQPGGGSGFTAKVNSLCVVTTTNNHNDPTGATGASYSDPHRSHGSYYANVISSPVAAQTFTGSLVNGVLTASSTGDQGFNVGDAITWPGQTKADQVKTFGTITTWNVTDTCFAASPLTSQTVASQTMTTVWDGGTRATFTGSISGGKLTVSSLTSGTVHGFYENLRWTGTNSLGRFQGQILTLSSIVTAGSGGTPGTYNGKTLVGSGNSATANITVGGGGTVTSCTLVAGGKAFQTRETLSVAPADIGGCTGFTIKADTISPYGFIRSGGDGVYDLSSKGNINNNASSASMKSYTADSFFGRVATNHRYNYDPLLTAESYNDYRRQGFDVAMVGSAYADQFEAGGGSQVLMPQICLVLYQDGFYQPQKALPPPKKG